MIKSNLLKKFWLVLILTSMINMFSIQAFAWGGDRDTKDRGGWGRDIGVRGRGVTRPYEVVAFGRDRYRYHDGKFFRLGWFGFEFALLTPPVGAIVTTIPAGHRTILAAGTTYYYYDNIYYTACPEGYIVAAAPVVIHNPPVVPVVPVVLQPQSPAATVTINVPNANGSYTPVNLIRKDNGYVGPQGEYYSGNPTVEQLRALYGK
ncbi:MAG: hypothetical protein PHH68_05120 [Candidatus Omnitrophica bacterium]|nr:hypothetical protein [Candidatus Omnitrophota bacterium]MDD5079693.1 hypothetical protein [Candidatus Omnitrophota bacterium]